jgi:energy-coupling factor transporter ATP-binding protein EcfA2
MIKNSNKLKSRRDLKMEENKNTNISESAKNLQESEESVIKSFENLIKNGLTAFSTESKKLEYNTIINKVGNSLANLDLMDKSKEDALRKLSAGYSNLICLISYELSRNTHALCSSLNDKQPTWRFPFKNSFETLVKDPEFIEWDEKAIKKTIKALKTKGVLLSGGTGTGKSYLARNIGTIIKDRLTNANGDRYTDVKYSKFTVGKLSPNLVSWGTSITGDYELGIILQAAILAEANPHTAYVVHLDEVTRSDFIGDLSSVFDFLSTKGKSTLKLPDFKKEYALPSREEREIKEVKGRPDTVTYVNNLYIVCTANTASTSGKRYETTPLTDSAFQDRFKKVDVVGVLENDEIFTKFKNNCLAEDKNPALSEFLDKLFKAFNDVEGDIKNKRESNKNTMVDELKRDISTRKLLEAIEENISSYSIKDLCDELDIEDERVIEKLTKLTE